ncbi:STAS-like domain-containing protein [Shewanella sp. 0m-4]
MNYNIGLNFCDTPAGRYKDDGQHTGEHFREDVLKGLIEKLEPEEKLIIKIDDVEGYGSSFLDEAFGGMVGKGYITADKFTDLLIIEFEDGDDAESFSFFKNKIYDYITKANTKKWK